MKILLAVDGSSGSETAIQEIVRRPWGTNSELKVITVAEIPIMPVVEPWGPPHNYFAVLERAAYEAATVVLEKALARLKRIATDSLKISSEVLQGPPAQTIVEEAERWGADLIVMGSRGLGAWSRLLLGSVSNSVVHHAKCSVEIVRRSNHFAVPT